MSKPLTMNKLLIATLAISMAAFGCTTNQFSTAGEPVRATPAGGPMTPSLSTTPGSAGPAIPATMVSGAVDPSVDAIAVLEANRGYQGRVLGPAAPGAQTTVMQRPTGQFISPSVLANPQLTVNSSLSSPNSVPAIVSGAGEAAGVVAAPGFVSVGAPGFASDAVVLPNVGNAGTTVGANANFGVTGVSNTTATGLTTITSATTTIPGGTNPVVGTRPAVAGPTVSSVVATPTLGTSGRLNAGNAVTTTATAPVRVETTAGRVTVTNSSSSNP